MANLFKEESVLDELKDKLLDLRKKDKGCSFCSKLCIFLTVVFLIATITAAACAAIYYFKRRFEFDDFIDEDSDDEEEDGDIPF